MENNQKRPVAKYEPGELDKIRKNLGDISNEEAMEIAKKLGGEIGVEKSVLADEKQLRRVKTAKMLSDKRAGKYVEPKKRETSSVQGTGTASTNESQTQDPNKPSAAIQDAVAAANAKKTYALPVINRKTYSAFNKLMINSNHGIKSNYYIFNFIHNFSDEESEAFAPQFIGQRLEPYVTHISKFINSVNKVLAVIPDKTKDNLRVSGEIGYKILFSISQWNSKLLKEQFDALYADSKNINIMKMVPIIQNIYKLIMKIYYLGETQVVIACKNLYTRLEKESIISKTSLMQFTKDISDEWSYIYNTVSYGLFPLLMRMSCSECVSYSEFMLKRTGKIMQFLEISKYDMILSTAKDDASNLTSLKPRELIDEAAKNPNPDLYGKGEPAPKDGITPLVKQGLEILNIMFPDAGFDKLDTHPDMGPYFQPLFQFGDGFGLLAPDNPLQVTMILVLIIEDMFQGCRKIHFNKGSLDDTNDFLSKINDWSLYHEDLFDKRYASELKEYVNQIYSQKEYAKSNYGKKQMTHIMWTSKSYFLQHLEFEITSMEKPVKDRVVKPLGIQTRFFMQEFAELEKNIETAIKQGNPPESIPGIENPWQHYNFSVPNAVSRRLDYILGGKKSKNLTNANLIKYTLCILSVLEWWINSAQSFAYKDNGKLPYRVSQEDGYPLFSVPVRKDQNDLFVASMKKIYEARANAQQNSSSGANTQQATANSKPASSTPATSAEKADK